MKTTFFAPKLKEIQLDMRFKEDLMIETACVYVCIYVCVRMYVVQNFTFFQKRLQEESSEEVFVPTDHCSLTYNGKYVLTRYNEALDAVVASLMGL